MTFARFNFFCLLLIASCTLFGQTKEWNYFSSNSFGYLLSDSPAVSFQSVNGISLNGKLHFGLGVGIEKVDGYNFTPVFLETKYHFRDQEKSTIPFISAMIGNEFSVFPRNRYGGLTTGIHTGVNHYFNKHIGITMNLGYRFIHLGNSMGLGEITLPAVYDKRFLELRAGLVIR